MLKEVAQQVVLVKQHLKEAQDQQRSYTDLKGTHQEFKVGDHVYLLVKPKRRSLKLRNYAKLAPQFCEPFEILDRIGLVAYRIALLANMRYHNKFHVSLLKGYVHGLNHIVD